MVAWHSPGVIQNRGLEPSVTQANSVAGRQGRDEKPESGVSEWKADRSRDRIERMSYQLKKMQAKHWKMLDLYFEGRTGKEMAEAVDRTPRTVSSATAG